ncbi:hypothetical protein HanHA300_Chr06g0197171 [Helianthus annuus]|nr:hypothetical protein HanHA300_Chr16g0627631 [Helianthus annuus]KAJ0462038.1 hypothetical protein HanHA89_Chr16g0678971 [Helianthus annuus]KAJ0559151.1 hypothetical protein HanHA300_Chr06g0197171 [Helianthus annuus]KAJ0572092.1 hypothetical protein HanHA89_Chr06g0211991 [Helianthus annuus]KAJ0642432.1 hypothetical protein HanLR1_Chr16g0638181 [Helianthus annuus]
MALSIFAILFPDFCRRSGTLGLTWVDFRFYSCVRFSSNIHLATDRRCQGFFYTL